MSDTTEYIGGTLRTGPHDDAPPVVRDMYGVYCPSITTRDRGADYWPKSERYLVEIDGRAVGDGPRYRFETFGTFKAANTWAEGASIAAHIQRAMLREETER